MFVRRLCRLNSKALKRVLVLSQVHKDFRLIVHLPMSTRAPAPFYNRFEKYLITVASMWEDVLSDSRLGESERKELIRVYA